MGNMWIQVVKDLGVYEVATGHLGLKQGRNRALSPCPQCGSSRRSSSDKRPPIGMTRDGKGWKCHASGCDAEGDVVDMIARHVLGRSSKEVMKDEWPQLEAWCHERGLVSGDAPRSSGRANVKSVASMVDKILGKKKPRGRRGSAPPEQGGGGKSSGVFSWRDGLAEQCAEALWEHPDGAGACAYLMEHRKLTEESIKHFGIGLFVDADGAPIVNKAGRTYITIPLADSAERVVNVRFRSVPKVGTCGDCDSPFGCKKCREYRVCTGRPLPLFGSQHLGSDLSGPVIITEGELDVVAMWCYGYTVSVVSGTAGAGADWKDEWLDEVEPYEVFVGLYDDDEVGEDGWIKLSETLGAYRCSRAILPRKDAGKCLEDDVPKESVQRAVDRAKPMMGMELRRIDSYAEELETLIRDPVALRGETTGSEQLDDMLGGWRPGLIIISGETSEGKTTFMDWAMLVQAQFGHAGMVTSFEGSPIEAVMKFMRMQLGQDFTAVTEAERLKALGELGELPLWILDHFGHVEPSKVIDAIRYAKRRHGCRYFLVDHLGFLVDPDAQDERKAIEAVIRAFALLKKQERVTIFLVVHPRNIPEGRGYQRVKMKHLKGASAIRQDADDVLIIVKEIPDRRMGRKVKRPWPQTRIFLDKVRSDFGHAGGNIALAFDPGSLIYADKWDDTPAGKQGLLVPRARAHEENVDDAKDPDAKPGDSG